MIKWPCLVVVSVACAGCAAPVIGGRDIEVEHGAVVSVDRHASDAGANILRRGGNAVDAAITTALALAVTHPQAGNLGGGGFMIVSMADGRRVAIDYREMAPARAKPDMFLDEHGKVDEERANLGFLPAGVPGTPAGLEQAHSLFGTIPLDQLAAPAIQLAREGFVVDESLARALAENADELRRFPASAAIFLHADGTPLAAGEILRQPDLAASLEAFAQGGAKPFYEGKVADQIAEAMAKDGGLIASEDLRRYRAVLREPLEFEFRGYEILSMPPPSSGGIALAQILGLLEKQDLRALGRLDPAALHLMAEAMRRAFADRAQYLGDPDFTVVPVKWLLSSAHLADLGQTISADRATPSRTLGPPLDQSPETSSTTHFSVIDAQRNAVSNTYTLEESFGCKAVVPGTGILLNNELHDFNVQPDVTDQEGSIGTKPNLAQPFKRPLSSMTPTIVLKGAKPVLITGSPGGRTIINTVACVVLGVLAFDLDARAAVDAPLVHQQWFPDRISVEEALAQPIRVELERRGHVLKIVPRLGDAHTIFIDDHDVCHGVADTRIDGWAAGY